MSRSKKGGVNGRRKNALAYLEKKLSEWNSHDKPFENHKNSRSHEAEQTRLEREIVNLKTKMKIV